jgi:DNA-binding GntR family transcriptional regulator
VEIPESRLTKALTEHEEIMAALERRDSSLLSGAIRDHIENTFRFFTDIFAVREGSSINQNDKLHFGAPKLA